MALGDLLALYEADSAEGIARRRDDTQLASARQRDGAAQDMRVVGGMLADELLRSNNGTAYADMNVAGRIPTTMDHPGNPSTP